MENILVDTKDDKKSDVVKVIKDYLVSITNKNGKYKRVNISPLRYAGGKSKAVGLILQEIPNIQEKKIISVFFGGGSVELVLSQLLGFNVIGYDIFSMLVNFWNVLIHNKDEFLEELKKFSITKEEFTKNRHILLNYWDKIKPKSLVYKTKKIIELDDNEKYMLDNDKILQAVYYYYNMTLSYGPMFLGWPSNNEINYNKFERRIKKINEMNIKNLSIFCEDFKDVIPKHKDDFLYLDPPYYLEGDSKMFKGLYPNCNFAIHHNNFDHKLLHTLLSKHKGGFILTYNNCSFIKDLYSDYTITYPIWHYTYGQGETRIGKNRKNKTNIKESHEIFIISKPSYLDTK
jgi:DNA adenine methylase